MESKNIEFKKAKYSSRIFSFAVDFILVTITTLLLMVCAQSIVSNTTYYQNIENTLDDIQERSNLYERDNGELVILSTYYGSPENENEYKEFNSKMDEALTKFYTDPFFFDQNDPNSGINIYNNQRIPEGQTHSDLFVYDGNNIVPSLNASLTDLHTFYVNAIKHEAIAYLMANDDYLDASKAVTMIFIFVELFIPLTISVFIYHLLIPLMDAHGRRTLGKRIFKIGIVDARGLSPKVGRFFFRFIIYYFLELLLSIFSFFLPIIVSFSMMAFKKTSQSFHDFVANTYVVDVSEGYICKSEKEYFEKQNIKAPDGRNIKFK